jgi:enoyl-CoA hydratase
MVAAMTEALLLWEKSPRVRLILIDATGPRAFCAGGDIGEVHQIATSNGSAAALAHCESEYALDLMIARYPKPVVVLVEGIAMGGGLGIACHASHPVASQSAKFAFPECAIGWVPDSGATHLLSRMPPAHARYLALTGARFGAEDALRLGLMRSVLVEGQREALVAELEASGDPDLIARYARSEPKITTDMPPDPVLSAFGETTVPGILAALEAAGDAHETDAGRITRALRRGSPFAQQLSLALIAAAREAPGLRPACARETSVIASLLDHDDFREGIRASLLDRDRRPAWRHDHAREIPSAEIDAVLARMPEKLTVSDD